MKTMCYVNKIFGVDDLSYVFGISVVSTQGLSFWVWGRTIGPGFDNVAMYPNYAAHAERMKQRKSYSELLEIEQSSN